MKSRKKNLPSIGWREWVGLPQLGIQTIKAKVDTGARSSSLHAYDIKKFTEQGEPWVEFSVHPLQRKSKQVITTRAAVFDVRSVRSSSGKASIRPVILTTITLLGESWSVELTLANRDEMGFRMLLGREAFRNRFLVDAGRSYIAGQPPREIQRNPGMEATSE